MKYLYLLAIIPMSLAATNLKIADKNVHSSPDLGKVKLFHCKDGFKAWRDGKMEKISSENLSAELRSIDTKNLKRYQKDAYIKLGKNSDGQITASSHVRGNAGGPILGEALYWGVKGGCYWAVGIAAQAVVDNVKGVKSGNTYIIEPGKDQLDVAIDKGGLWGPAALALKTVATKGPKIIGTHSFIGSAAQAKQIMSSPAWDNISSIGTGPGTMIGYHSASYQSPFMASQMARTSIMTPARLSTWAGSAAVGHYVYKEGMMGSAGRAQWDAGMSTAIKTANSTLSDKALEGATLGIGTMATQGAGKMGAVGGIEMLAQAARSWGYAQLWCP